MKRIPVLAVLKQNVDTEASTDSKTVEENATSTSSISISNIKEITLFEWISSSDNKSTLDQVYEHCQRGLEQVKASPEFLDLATIITVSVR